MLLLLLSFGTLPIGGGCILLVVVQPSVHALFELREAIVVLGQSSVGGRRTGKVLANFWMQAVPELPHELDARGGSWWWWLVAQQARSSV